MKPVRTLSSQRNTRENVIEKYLITQCKKAKFRCYKFVSPGFTGVPDRIVIGNGSVVFVELKRPGEKPRPRQIVVHQEMKEVGADVRVIDTTDGIDNLIQELSNKSAWD